ncbi:uncharacterized mitochondrial protein AtMg00810-like [Arachis hypogaea]|uniref:uncharacterized mitochondrial protein AtMg00810-like n=1 Tax=Arachis hypogaea TaxID=3818 RepID=UPI000DEC9081|nr:uncharacterized protein LOC112795375 [Arachis hypogaea]
MKQPPGYEQGDPSLVCKLTKALYGLKQAPREWYYKLAGGLREIGFEATKSDISVFIQNHRGLKTYVLVYVDDIIVTGESTELVKEVIAKLNDKFALKDMGDLHYFLGIQVNKTCDKGLILTQQKYIHELLKKAGMVGCAPCHTPLPSTVKITALGGSSFCDPQLYRSIIGSLQYLTITRPEICYSVNKLSQFVQAPLESHWKLVKRVLRYLSGTSSYGLHLKRETSLGITTYSDSDWAGDPDDRKSTSGYCIFLGTNLISWTSKKQTVVARSSTEAEYRSMAEAVAELTWIKTMMRELLHPLPEAPMLYCDNLSAVLLAANPILHSKSKHFEIDLHFVRDFVNSKAIQVSHIPGSVQVADILTKAIPSENLLHFRGRLSVHNQQQMTATEDSGDA